MKQYNFGSNNMTDKFSLDKFISIFFNWYRFDIYFALNYDLYSINIDLNFLDDLILIAYDYLFITFFWQFSIFFETTDKAILKTITLLRKGVRVKGTEAVN